jgi:hypothetical protein
MDDGIARIFESDDLVVQYDQRMKEIHFSYGPLGSWVPEATVIEACNAVLAHFGKEGKAG